MTKYMRLLALITFLFVTSFSGLAQSRDIVNLSKALEIYKNEKGVCISTNRASIPWLLVQEAVDLQSLVGKPSSSINQQTVIVSEQRQNYSPNTQQFGPGFYTVSKGRYAYLQDRVLTLTDYCVYIGDKEQMSDQVLCVVNKSVTVQIDSGIISLIKKLSEN